MRDADAAREPCVDQSAPGDQDPVPVARSAACDPHPRLFAGSERRQSAVSDGSRASVEQARRGVVDLEAERQWPILTSRFARYKACACSRETCLLGN